jgi:RNase P/RNase MRP subunit p30
LVTRRGKNSAKKAKNKNKNNLKIIFVTPSYEKVKKESWSERECLLVLVNLVGH